MYGAILGDIIGAVYEYDGMKTKRFDLFPKGCDITDDTIMTIAVARGLLQWKRESGDLHRHMIFHMKQLGRKYPHPLGAYGYRFYHWLMGEDEKPYNSCGNGSAMRVAACGLVAESLAEALELAKISSEVTHDHPEGIKGAQATAAAIYMAKNGCDKQQIRDYIHENFYSMTRTLNEIRPKYGFEATCQKSVPESIIAFLESESFEDAIRNVISLGGDADTMGAITGAIAWSYYRFRSGQGISKEMADLQKKAEEYMPDDFIETCAQIDKWCLESLRR